MLLSKPARHGDNERYQMFLERPKPSKRYQWVETPDHEIVGLSLLSVGALKGKGWGNCGIFIGHDFGWLLYAAYASTLGTFVMNLAYCH